MTDDTPQNPDQSPAEAAAATPDRKPEPKAADKTDRIAKVMARAGVASRREAERMIVEGRVKVNGKQIDSPALDVSPSDRVTIDGKPLDEPQETRLWLYYKPIGLITSENDELGRQTVFDALPRDLPRVMTVGRLDLNSEGLLLLTNDGDLKRRLELPSTGWLRRYRVRVNGTPSDMTFGPLRRGATIDGEDFAPMEIKLDSQQGANAWLTVGIREGKNREIRRAMTHVGLQVNRLIRIGYGPFKLIGLEKNQVSEVKRRVLRDQLGGLLTGEVIEKEREMRPRGAENNEDRAARFSDRDARPPRKEWDKGGADRRGPRDDADNQDRPRRFGTARPAADGGSRFDRGPKSGDRPDRGDRPQYKTDRPQFGKSDRPDNRGERSGDRPQYKSDRPQFGKSDRPDNRGERSGDRPQYKSDRPQFGKSDRPDSRGERGGDRPQYKGDRPQFGKSDRPDNRGERSGDRPQYKSDRPQYAKSDRPGDKGGRFERKGDRPERAGDKPARSFGGAPRGGPRDQDARLAQGGYRDRKDGVQGGDRDGQARGYQRRDRDDGDKPRSGAGPSASRWAGQKGAGAPAGRRHEGEPYKGPRDKGESRPAEDGKARSAYPRPGKPAGRTDSKGPRTFSGKPSFGKPSGKPSGRPSDAPSGGPAGGRPKSGPRR